MATSRSLYSFEKWTLKSFVLYASRFLLIQLYIAKLAPKTAILKFALYTSVLIEMCSFLAITNIIFITNRPSQIFGSTLIATIFGLLQFLINTLLCIHNAVAFRSPAKFFLATLILLFPAGIGIWVNTYGYRRLFSSREPTLLIHDGAPYLNCSEQDNGPLALAYRLQEQNGQPCHSRRMSEESQDRMFCLEEDRLLIEPITSHRALSSKIVTPDGIEMNILSTLSTMQPSPSHGSSLSSEHVNETNNDDDYGHSPHSPLLQDTGQSCHRFRFLFRVKFFDGIAARSLNYLALFEITITMAELGLAFIGISTGNYSGVPLLSLTRDNILILLGSPLATLGCLGMLGIAVIRPWATPIFGLSYLGTIAMKFKFFNNMFNKLFPGEVSRDYRPSTYYLGLLLWIDSIRLAADIMLILCIIGSIIEYWHFWGSNRKSIYTIV